jgi:hypothetical protein
MDRRVNSAPRAGIQLARKKQILIFNKGIDNFIKLIDIFQAEYPLIIEKWKK